MDERVARLEALVADLSERVAELETRLASPNHAAGIPRDPSSAHDPLTAVAEIGAVSVQQWLALVGRTLVVLGGAYLLRAITESHVLLPQVGVALGLMYGAPWLLLASRAEGRGAHLDALCHALSTALIGYPLVWEATVRFQVLTATESAVLLAALTAAALMLSSRRELQSLAWIVTFGALGSALGLAAATSAWVPYTLVAIGVGLATLWLGYVKGWAELRWPAALAANFMLFVATGRAGAHGAVASVVWLQAMMLAGYLGSFTIRTVSGSHPLVPFEVVQSAGALAVGFGGLIYLLFDSILGLQILGIISLIIAAVVYGMAFVFTERQRPRANLLFQSLLGCFFAIAGLAVGFGQVFASLAYAALAVATLGLARTHSRLILVLHASLYAIGASIASGLLTNATLSIATPAAADVGPPGLISLAALAVLLAVTAMPVRDTRKQWSNLNAVSRCMVAALATWTGAGVTVAFALSVLPGPLDASQISTIRTVVLVASAVAAAAAGRHPAGREAAWLTYPLLLIAGMKLVFVDFIQGRPTTLFAALAVYGAALIIAPRMLRRDVAASTDAALQARRVAVDDVAAVGRGLETAAVTAAHPQTTAR